MSNLAFTFSLLSGQKAADIRTFYKFCRLVDDTADSATLSIVEKSHTLWNWANAFVTRDYSAFPHELSELILRRALNPALFLEIIYGVSSDIYSVFYQTIPALCQYCWRVASAVGLISIQILECKDPKSSMYAEVLGIALQLTHILRDIGKDARLGRVYLPEADLRRFHVTRAALLRQECEPGFYELMKFESQYIRNLFAEAKVVCPRSDRKKLIPAEIMRIAYEALLNLMENDGFQSFKKYYTLSSTQKIWCVIRALELS